MEDFKKKRDSIKGKKTTALGTQRLKQNVDVADEEALRSFFLEGINSGSSVDAELVFSRLRTKYSSLLRNQNFKKEKE